MRRISLGLAALASFVFVLSAASQPPDGKERQGRGGKNKGGQGGGPGPFELSRMRVLPPFVMEELTLTDDQERQLAELDAMVRERVGKILTDDQKKQIEGLRPRGPGGFGQGDKGGKQRGDKGPGQGKGRGGDKGEPPDDKNGRDGPPPNQANAGTTTSGIQWYATWESGKAEARRTGKPILLVSAAPHCAGVSGIW